MDSNLFYETTPEITDLANIVKNTDYIDKELYTKYNVNRGL